MFKHLYEEFQNATKELETLDSPTSFEETLSNDEALRSLAPKIEDATDLATLKLAVLYKLRNYDKMQRRLALLSRRELYRTIALSTIAGALAVGFAIIPFIKWLIALK